MKQKVLLFFANLLAKMKQPLLPHINVYRPVHVSLVFPYKFLSKLVGIKCFYIQPCGICLCKSIFQANFDCRFVNDIYCVEELSVSVSNTLFSNFSLA